MRKKRTKKVSGEVDWVETNYSESPSDDGNGLKLTSKEMLELRAITAEAKLHALEVAHYVLQRDLYLKQIDPEGKLGKLNALVRSASDNTAAATTEQKRIRSAIEARLGIDDLSKYAYDEISGVLQLADQ